MPREVLLRPLGDRVLLRAVDMSEETTIIVPEMARERPAVGEVVAVGEAVRAVAVGDHVFYGQFSGTPVAVTGEPLLLLREDDLLAVVEAVPV